MVSCPRRDVRGRIGKDRCLQKLLRRIKGIRDQRRPELEQMKEKFRAARKACKEFHDLQIMRLVFLQINEEKIGRLEMKMKRRIKAIMEAEEVRQIKSFRAIEARKVRSIRRKLGILLKEPPDRRDHEQSVA